ncbi:chemotaxis protein CheY [Paenibacillus sp. FSL R7-277]|uniref:response regulator transcription factor n=1 Tax=Paenibacillus sp. FSL R7-277 TaxID=1227352 RepID=UPI0003E1FBE1|nr:response regulator [Paenibacillus sp. FSL R7-277]ETT59242.1 chemotaxis protein CheY [Paenibacillus sp. FSL R7-277]
MLKVLIIDDEPWSRQVVKSLGAWEEHGMQVIGEAEDGIEGLELIEALHPGLVITDMRMPGLDGVELLERLNRQYPEVQIIVMSGYDDFVYLKQAIRSKAAEYLLKPVDRTELNHVLSACAKERERQRLTGSPLMLMEQSLMEHYLAYRQRIYDQLLALNKPAVREELEKLGRELEHSVPQHQLEAMLERTSRDLLLLAGEAAKTSGMDPGADAGTTDKPWPSVQAMVTGLAAHFTELVNTALEQRRNRIRLDMAEVEAYIRGHFHEPLSLEGIAAHFLVTKEHLSRAFKAATGDTVIEHITSLRMERARELIAARDLPIKDAAALCGYEDLAYFYRVFKKHFGIPPGELRSEK